jgi:hypothetical protein
MILNQCCGSESAWVRIHWAVLDPDPYWECGSGSRSMEILKKLTKTLSFLPSKKAFVLL